MGASSVGVATHRQRQRRHSGTPALPMDRGHRAPVHAGLLDQTGEQRRALFLVVMLANKQTALQYTKATNYDEMKYLRQYFQSLINPGQK